MEVLERMALSSWVDHVFEPVTDGQQQYVSGLLLPLIKKNNLSEEHFRNIAELSLEIWRTFRLQQTPDSTIGKRTDTSWNPCDYHNETAEHFLRECLAFMNIRRKYLGNYTIRYRQIRELYIRKHILSYIFSSGRFSTIGNDYNQMLYSEHSEPNGGHRACVILDRNVENSCFHWQ